MIRALRFVRVALAARRIQDHLWDRPGHRTGPDRSAATWADWMWNLDKRVGRLSLVEPSHPNWRVEAKKRLLQLATVAVAMSEAIDAGAIAPSPTATGEGDR